MDDYFDPKVGVHSEIAPPLLSPGQEQKNEYISPLDTPAEEGVGGSPNYKSQELLNEGGSQDSPFRNKPILSPSELVTVLENELSPPPKAQTRFLHGGPALSSLAAPSVVNPTSVPGSSSLLAVTVPRSSSWRAFTDEEEDRLQKGWIRLQEEDNKSKGNETGLEVSPPNVKSKSEELGGGGQAKSKGNQIESEVADPDSETSSHIIPVGLDSLFSVNLRQDILCPDFWAGTPVRVQQSLWFYAPSSSSSKTVPLPKDGPGSIIGIHSSGSKNTNKKVRQLIPSHLLKVYPVDAVLSTALEKAYRQIRPWESSYEAELHSSLSTGQDAEEKLKVPLDSISSSATDIPSDSVSAPDTPATTGATPSSVPPNTGTETPSSKEQGDATKGGLSEKKAVTNSSTAGVDVIFQDAQVARVYSRSFVGSVGRGFLSSGKELGGGQAVLRGWEAVRLWRKGKVRPLEDDQDNNSNNPSVVKPDDSSAISDGEYDSDGTPTGSRSRKGSGSSHMSASGKSASGYISSSEGFLKPAEIKVHAHAPPQGFFSALKTKLGAIPTPPVVTNQTQDSGAIKGRTEREKGTNATQEAMEGPRNRNELGEGENTGESSGGGEVGGVDELVLVVHGIGQKLAGTYSSFNFVHAVNLLRTSCTNLSTSPSIAPLLHSKRAQFIPVLWRADLSFDDSQIEQGDKAEERLGNRFSLEDIEIKDSVPLLRQVVSGLVLDVPFYLSHHKEKMMKAVVKDANRIYRLFCARNPSFLAKGGRVSIIAHSLGSALTADILSNQPTFVKPLKDMTTEEKKSEKEFVFDTRALILVGSPLAFFLHLSGKGQLIARHGRERSKHVDQEIALDRSGRYGCMACDSVYNVYHETDPVAFALNAAVDVEYARSIRPIAIPSTNQTLVQNLTDTYSRVTKLFDVSSLWASLPTAVGGGGAAVGALSGKAQRSASPDREELEEVILEQKDSEDAAEAEARESKGERSKVDRRDQGQDESGGTKKSAGRRPGQAKRMPSEMPGLKKEEFERISRAEKRFKALNPQGCIDFYLPAEGVNQYLEALSSHGAYWNDPRFSTFVLTQLFASESDLERTGRQEIGESAD